MKCVYHWIGPDLTKAEMHSLVAKNQWLPWKLSLTEGVSSIKISQNALEKHCLEHENVQYLNKI